MPDFESFSRTMLSLDADPRITIHKRGTISLNRSAFAALGSPDAVELLFDRQRSIVGLRAVDQKADNAYLVRTGARRSKRAVGHLGHGVHEVLRHRHLGVAAVGRADSTTASCVPTSPAPAPRSTARDRLAARAVDGPRRLSGFSAG